MVKQYYEVQVYDEYVIRGNTAVLTCHVPSFVKDYVTVTSWIRDDVLTLASNAHEGKNENILKQITYLLHYKSLGLTTLLRS